MRSLSRDGRFATLDWIVLAVVATAVAFVGSGCGPVPLPATPTAVQAEILRGTVPSSEPGVRATQVRGQLRPSGRWLAYPDGSRFRWRGVSGFMLNEQVSSGREADAVAFLAWAKRTGFNVVRVLAMLPKGWFTDTDFTPEEGLAALPRTLFLARDADMYVQVTVLANTRSLPAKADLGDYVERAGRICAAAGNCALVEMANEIYHQTQRPEVHDPGTLARWAVRVPPGIPTALGAPPDASASLVYQAPVITIHLDRGGERWSRARRVRELGEASAHLNRFVIDNEPIGADERGRPGQRDNLPEVFFAQGALSRVFEVGSTFHFENGLRARVPGPVQQQCAEAFISGTRIVDDAYMLTFQDTGWPYAPVRAVRLPSPARPPGADARPQTTSPEGGVFAAFAGLTQVIPSSPNPSNVLVLIGAEGDPGIEWRSPWRQSGVIAAWPHVQVWSIARGE